MSARREAAFSIRAWWRAAAAAFVLLAAAGAASARPQAAAAPPAAMVDNLQDLPLAVYPAPHPSGAFVLLLSGDGGWRGLDRSLAHAFNAAGIGVIGLNSLMYFWQKRSAAEVACDLERIVAAYRRRWHAEPAGLVGYSFGADVIPFAWPGLSAPTRASVRVIALVGITPTALFQVTVMDLLGVVMPDEIPIGPAVARLPRRRLLCIYGALERARGASGCTLPEMRGARLVERPGGHDFSGDYAPLAEAIIERLREPADAGALRRPRRG